MPQESFFCAGASSVNNNYLFIGWQGSDALTVSSYGAPESVNVTTSALQRDSSAWYHVVVAFDTTQSTASNRVKLYINGGLITSFSSTTYPTLNQQFYVNDTTEHQLGRSREPDFFFDGYLAEINFIDGQQLTPSDFGEFGVYGEWKPIEYKGTHGTNGFYLDFKTSGTLGNDASSNSNNWTTNNLAATDQMLDSPTNNFATWTTVDALNSSGLQDGGLRIEPNPSNRWRASIAPSSGKWYYEIYNEYQHHSTIAMGVKGLGTLLSDVSDAVYVMHPTDFTLSIGGSTVGTFGTMGGEKIIGVAYDVDAQTISFYHNGSAIHATLTDYDYSGMSNSEWVAPYLNIGQGRRVRANFGQDSSFAGTKTAQGNQDGNDIGDFYYTPPSGFLALCSANLPDPTVIPSEHFNTITYTGTDADNRAITGVGFAPDFAWFKRRNSATNHGLFDVVRGANKRLSSNLTDDELSDDNALMSFDSDGYTVSSDGTTNAGGTYVAWNWKGGGTAVSNTAGSITSSVSANTDAGFSIVSYTGNGSDGATVGHGLSQAPDMIISKRRNSTYGWLVYARPMGITKYMALDLTMAEDGPSTYWNSTEHTSSVFSTVDSQYINTSGGTYIAYCFHSVDGYSKVGSYTGNGSTDGTFVYTGFRPAMIIAKRSTSIEDWQIIDTTRASYNVADIRLNPNNSNAEVSNTNGGDRLDILSNGFKGRDPAGQWNASGSTYIYIAFAEMPFKHSNAR
jgi:hypothetical protein